MPVFEGTKKDLTASPFGLREDQLRNWIYVQIRLGGLDSSCCRFSSAAGLAIVGREKDESPHADSGHLARRLQHDVAIPLPSVYVDFLKLSAHSRDVSIASPKRADSRSIP